MSPFITQFQLKNTSKVSILLIVSQLIIIIKAQPKTICPKSFTFAQQEQMDYYLDLLQSPCEDFHEYACGNWRVKYPLRVLGASDTLSSIKASNKQLLIDYLEKEQDDFIENNSTLLKTAAKIAPVHKLVINLYQSCLERRAWKNKNENEYGLQLYINILRSFAPMWPILDKNYTVLNTNNTFHLEYILGEMRKYGVQTLFRVMVQANWQLSQQSIFYIMPPTFEWLKRQRTDSHYDEESVFLYKRYIKSLIMDLKVRVRKANQLAEEIVEFEKSLFGLDNNHHSIVLREPQTLQNLLKEIPQFNFQQFFSTLLKGFELPDEWPEKLLVVTDTVYLNELVKFIERSKAETIAKYLLIQFLIHFEVNLLDDESYTKQKNACLQLVNDFLPDNLSKLYIELLPQTSNGFTQVSRTHLMQIFEKLKNQFSKMLNTSVVFEKDPKTKLESLEKLQRMRLLIPEINEATNPHANIDISLVSNNYDLNIINLWQLKTKQQLNHVVNQMSNNSMNTLSAIQQDAMDAKGPLDVNAYYHLKTNAIELPIGLLRTPLYHTCLKSAQLYGSIVYILAHELIHGFDYDGLNYDYSGSETSGWGVKALIKFGVRANCYLNVKYKNGSLNINENIADTEGLRLALETYLDQDMLGTFDVADLKLFFISFAQTWCGSSLNKNSSNKSLHTDNKERVNNALSNFMEFSDIFKCSPGVVMNPEEKCRIW